MRLFPNLNCPITKTGNKTANIKNGDNSFAAVDILATCLQTCYYHFFLLFLADRTNGRAYATVLRLSVCLSVCPSVRL